MGSLRAFTVSLLIASTLPLGMVGCAGDRLFDQLTSFSTNVSGYIAVATVSNVNNTTLTGPGWISLFDSSGRFVRVLGDYFSEGAYSSGLGLLGTTLVASIANVDRYELNDPVSGQNTRDVSHSGLASTPLRGMVVDGGGNVFIVEGNTGSGQIEKFNSSHDRVGSPFIPATVGACSLADPWAITYIPTTDQIVVTNTSANRIIFYDVASGTTCSVVNNAAFGSNTVGIAYHAATDKLLTTRVGDEAVYQSDVDGTNPAEAYLNTSRVTNPYSIAIDAAGYVYVGSAGTDTIEKFTFDGTNLTSVGTIVGPNAYSQNPVAIVVFP